MLTEQNISKLFMLVVEVESDGKIIFSSHLRSPHKNTEGLYNLLFDAFRYICAEIRSSPEIEYFKIISNDETVQYIEAKDGYVEEKAFSAMIQIARDIDAIYSEYENFGKTNHPFGTPYAQPREDDCIALREIAYNTVGDSAIKNSMDKEKLEIE